MLGLLVPLPLPVDPFLVITDGDGVVPLPFVLPGDMPADVELWVQWAVVDSGAVQGVALSNALMGRTSWRVRGRDLTCGSSRRPGSSTGR